MTLECFSTMRLHPQHGLYVLRKRHNDVMADDVIRTDESFQHLKNRGQQLRDMSAFPILDIF